MKHYILLKLVDGVDPVKVQEKIWKTCQKLDDALDWMNRPAIFRSCMETRSSYDLMVEFNLDGEEQLNAFEAHPLYQKLEDDLKEKVAARASFDHY